MTSNYSTIDVEKENNRVKTFNVTFNKLRIYVTLYHTYPLLYYKEHIQMISNHTIKNVEKKTKSKQNVNIASNLV